MTVRVAIAGFGKVGRATADLLLSRRDRYRSLYGIDVRLVAVCGARAGVVDPAGLEAPRFDALEAGQSGLQFIAASGADVLIEAGPSDFRTGGPALQYLRAALARGCDAIVVSKGALVYDGRGLLELARGSGAALKISGATAAALPTIDLFTYNLKGCMVLEVEGILNATTNYLLHAMTTRRIGLDAALREAQASGVAERDPRNDIEGWDTACKLLILANFGLDADLLLSDVSIQGMESVTAAQIDAWRAKELVPKLVGRLTREGDRYRAQVGVRAYARTDVLAYVSGTNKAIRIITDVMGEIIAIGGGPEPTATAAAALKDFELLLQSRSTPRRLSSSETHSTEYGE